MVILTRSSGKEGGNIHLLLHVAGCTEQVWRGGWSSRCGGRRIRFYVSSGVIIWCYLMLSANVNLPLCTAQATFHPPVLFSFFAAKAATVVLTVFVVFAVLSIIYWTV
jgi:hypothetical protein